MRKTLEELRLARGWKLKDLARLTTIPLSTLSRFESGQRGANSVQFDKLCEVLGCRADELDLRRADQKGRPKRSAAELLDLFRPRPVRLPPPEWSCASRLDYLLKNYSHYLSEHEHRLPEWDAYLRHAASDNPPEALWQIRQLVDGAQTTELSLAWLHYAGWSICDEDGKEASHYLRPALITAHWISFSQVYVQTPGGRFRMDMLVVVRGPQHVPVLLEVDGEHRNPAYDARRQKAIGYPAIRVPNRDILTGPGLTERLQALGFSCAG